MVFAHGLDLSGKFLWDGLSKLYLAAIIIWTTTIFAGAAFLILNRNLQCVRVRNLPLVLGSMLCLHLFWIAILAGYWFNGMVPCAAEYWVMSVYLPLGLALYQASHMQLLSIATSQSRMVTANMDKKSVADRDRPIIQRSWRRWSEMSLIRQTMWALWAILFAQIIVTLALFLGSRKFHSWGTFGTHVDPVSCRRGPEWLPSIIVQFTWAWILAPLILWKIRHIKDVYHWRLQTTCAVLAGMPGTPLWIAALYSPETSGWAKVNMYWPPPFWFSIPIVIVEALLVFVPCYEVLRSVRHQRYISAVLHEWQSRRHGGGDGRSQHFHSQEPLGYQKSLSSSKASSRSQMYARSMFEKHLEGDTDALLKFAALREFTGENIIFLQFVRDWKRAWSEQQTTTPAEQRRHFFKVAVEIYVDYVDMKTAEFPINIDHDLYTRLERMFGGAAKALNRPQYEDFITPFSNSREASAPALADANSAIELVSNTSPPPKENIFDEEVLPWSPADMANHQRRSIMSYNTQLPSNVMIPFDFGINVWDRTEEAVKHLVFSNTWPKFIDTTVEESSFADTENEPEMPGSRLRSGFCFL